MRARSPQVAGIDSVWIPNPPAKFRLLKRDLSVPARLAVVLFLVILIVSPSRSIAASSDVDGEIKSLQESIEKSQESIGEAAAEDARLRESRSAIDTLLHEADAASLRGDAPAARAALKRARGMVVPGDQATLDRILLASATVELRAGNFAAARAAMAEVQHNQQVTAGVGRRLGILQTRLSAKMAAEAKHAEKEQTARELAAIEALPPKQAVAAAARLYAANPSDEDIALTYARLLARDWHWTEAEKVYGRIIGSASGEGLLAHERAALGLVDLYSRTNRLSQANSLLDWLESAHGNVMPPDSRNAVLRSRIDTALMPNQLSGSITLNGGYDTNVSGTLDIEDNNGTKTKSGPSAFLGGAGNLTYSRVLSPNGDKLRLHASANDFHYFANDLDRSNFDVSAGYWHPVPGTADDVESSIGYRDRFTDANSYRRTLYAAFALNQSLLRQLDLSSALVLEANDDDNPKRDGYAVVAGTQAGYDITANDSVGAGLSLRYNAAEASSETYWEPAASLSYRHDFDISAMSGFYVEAAYAPSYTLYDAPAKSGQPARADLTNRLYVALGRRVNDWLAEIRGSYRARDSNISNKDTSSARVTVSLTRYFSTAWK